MLTERFGVVYERKRIDKVAMRLELVRFRRHVICRRQRAEAAFFLRDDSFAEEFREVRLHDASIEFVCDSTTIIRLSDEVAQRLPGNV